MKIAGIKLKANNSVFIRNLGKERNIPKLKKCLIIQISKVTRNNKVEIIKYIY